MKNIVLFLLFPVFAFSQSIKVDKDSYTPQELIRDVLVNSSCIRNITVTEAAGGNFIDSSQSFGFFDAGGTSFPLKKGLVLSTGKLNSITKPTSFLSDDDVPGWNGDSDLDAEFQVNTQNATILEFDFTPDVSHISFRYLFASEEYQAGNPNTCRFSDVFAFFIKQKGGSEYQNLALVPNTTTPVSVTTVHPDISQGCSAINETYFDRFNINAPIVFDGQTTVLTASANVTIGETYHVKLVIGDDENYRFDSAVFLEAGSFQPTVDLGPDRLISTENALCQDETYTLNANDAVGNTYFWYKDRTLLSGETNNELGVTSPGIYAVKVISNSGCESNGEVVIEYSRPLETANMVLKSCDPNNDGLAVYNLYDSETDIFNGSESFEIEGFYLTKNDAENQTNSISEPENFQNNVSEQAIFARVENSAGCFEIAEISLELNIYEIEITPFQVCDNFPVDGFTTVSLQEITDSFRTQISEDALVRYFPTEPDALQNINEIQDNFTNTTANSQKLFIRIEDENSCFLVTEINIEILAPPILIEDESIFYCPGQEIQLNAGIINDEPNLTFRWFLNDVPLSENSDVILVNEPGNYRTEVSNESGCTNFRNIEVILSETPDIENVALDQSTNGSRVEVNVSGNGDYEFSIDSEENFQSGNAFTNVAAGSHTAFVRNRNGCGLAQFDFSVFGYDRYFTPNGDGINDFWELKGIEGNYRISIFNRYGKLLRELTPAYPKWNGVFNGQNMPANEYWFKLQMENGEQLSGHFSLIR